MTIMLNFNHKSFLKNMLNLDRSIDTVVITYKNINIKLLCDILENIDAKINVIVPLKEDEIKKEWNKRGTFQGFNKSILNRVKKICQDNLTKNDLAVDMTVGNGNDTLFLANCAKKVFGFDIQRQAYENTMDLLKKNNIDNYQLFLESHDNINTILSAYKHNIKLILFNLGYLPKSDKSIMTNHTTTLKALINSFEMLTSDGLILMVFYPHEEGKKEALAIKSYLKDNQISFKEYHNTLNSFAPYLIVI